MKEKAKRTGRIPKLNPKTHCVMVRFDDEEHARFLTMYEQSGEYAKAVLSRRGYSGRNLKLSGWIILSPNTMPSCRICTRSSDASVSITTRP